MKTNAISQLPPSSPATRVAPRLRNWLQAVRDRIFMDAPADWDVHPDVAAKVRPLR